MTENARHSMENGVCASCGRRESTAGLQFYLNSDGKSYMLSHVTADCTATDIVIDLYLGLPVTRIADEVFSQNPAYTNRIPITSVVIGADVREIGRWAFLNCTTLHTVTFQTAHDVILSLFSLNGTGVFEGCAGIKRVYADDLYAYCRMNYGCYYETNTLKGLFRREFSSFANDIPACLASVTLSRVTVYVPEMFAGAEGLTEVILADGVARDPI